MGRFCVPICLVCRIFIGVLKTSRVWFRCEENATVFCTLCPYPSSLQARRKGENCQLKFVLWEVFSTWLLHIQIPNGPSKRLVT